MRLQTDQEFKQKNIEELNKKFNVEMYSTHLRGGKLLQQNKKEVNVYKNLRVNVLKQTNWKKQLLAYIIQGLQNTDIHQSKLKNKHLIPKQENTFKKFMIFIN